MAQFHSDKCLNLLSVIQAGCETNNALTLRPRTMHTRRLCGLRHPRHALPGRSLFPHRTPLLDFPGNPRSDSHDHRQQAYLGCDSGRQPCNRRKNAPFTWVSNGAVTFLRHTYSPCTHVYERVYMFPEPRTSYCLISSALKCFLRTCQA